MFKGGAPSQMRFVVAEGLAHLSGALVMVEKTRAIEGALQNAERVYVVNEVELFFVDVSGPMLVTW